MSTPTVPHFRRNALVMLAGAGLLALASLGLTAQPTGAQPSGPTSIPVPKTNTSEVNTLFLPPGKYTAIVIATNAQTRRWYVTLRTNSGSFPIVVAPSETTVIPFTAGFVVSPSDNARLESRLVPFDDLSERTPVDGNDNLLLSAWGITERGPVNFQPPANRKTK